MLLQKDMCTKISESRMNQQLVLFVLLSIIYTEKKSYSNIPRTALVLHANIPRKIILQNNSLTVSLIEHIVEREM